VCRPRPDAGDRHRHRAPRRRRRPGRRAARGDHAASLPAFFDNVTIGGGPAPARAYIEELLPDILEGRIEPGRVLDRTVDLDGYRAMADREALKVMIKP
jgi:threonine dehydrogenase-like Zn-dependent dehydrogenase